MFGYQQFRGAGLEMAKVLVTPPI